MSSHRRGVLLIAAGALLWSSEGLLVRSLGISGWPLVFAANAVMGVTVAGWTLARHGTRAGAALRAIGVPGLIAGLCLGMGNVFYYLAYQYTSVANIYVMVAMQPLAAALFARMLLGESVRWTTFAASAVIFAGVLVMISGSIDRVAWRGDVLALGASLLYSANIVALRSVAPDHGAERDVMPSNALAGFLAAGLAFPLAVPFAIAPSDVATVLVIGVFSLALGMFCYTRGAPRVRAAEAALIVLIQIPLAPLYVWLAFGEAPRPETVIGGGLILAAIVAHTIAGWRQSA